MMQKFAVIVLGGTGQAGGATVAEVLAVPECLREVVMATRKPNATRSRMFQPLGHSVRGGLLSVTICGRSA